MVGTDGLQSALIDLDVHIERGNVESLMADMDLDEKGGLDFKEFKRAVQQPPTQLEQWASMLSLAGMLARSLPCGDGLGDQPLTDFGLLSLDEINASVDVFSEGLRVLLGKMKVASRQMFDSMDKKAAKDSADCVSVVAKFKTFKMSTGSVAEYHESLFRRIGG